MSGVVIPIKEDLSDLLEASVPVMKERDARAKRARREALLAQITGLRIEAQRQYRMGGQTRVDAEVLHMAWEAECCGLRALLEEAK